MRTKLNPYTIIASSRQWLMRPVSGLNLGILRFGFGSLMVVMLSKYAGMITPYFTKDSSIPYPGLEFIKPLAEDPLRTLFYIGMAVAILTALGVFFRYSCFLLTLVLAYALFLNRVIFNNHYYLFILISFLLVFTNADERFSLRSVFRNKPKVNIPYWQYFILQLQIGVVFFFGGISKINADWLSGAVTDPMMWSAFGKFDQLHLVSLIFAWTGMLFDLLIPFFLFFRRTRKYAVVAVVLFNLINGLVLFDNIGLFPYTMIVLTVLVFLDPGYIQKWAQKAKRKSADSHVENGLAGIPAMQVWTPLLILYFVFQFTFPLRQFFIPGNPDWTGLGVTFAWRMKSSSKLIKLQFKAIDKATGKFLSDVQMGFDFKTEQIYAYTHYAVWYMAQRVHQRFAERGRPDFGVVADYYVSMNGQPMQKAIDPAVDLSAVQYHPYGGNTWMLPWHRKSRKEIEKIQQEQIESLKH
jgi:vitamin K-dependent gamma-carboxylase